MASQPNFLLGYMDNGALSIDGFGAVVDYLLENIPQVRHPWSIPTFAQMSHEPQLAAILRVYNLALARGTWTLNGEGCDPKVTAQLADDLGLQVKGGDNPPTGARRRRFTWSKHLRTAASLSLKYGHAPFAQSWVERAGMWRLDMVQERMPQTITDVFLNTDGTLKSAEQGEGATAEAPVTITTADHRLVWYDREREGSNYYGQSLLRPSFPLWVIKSELMRVWPTSNRRNGMGVWQVTAPPGATPQQVIEAQRIASTTRASEAAGLGLPPGFLAELKGMSGTLPDHNELVTYLDRQMTRSTLTSILDMATSERGNRSLGETVMALMVFAQQAEGQRIAEDATEQIVIPLVDANFGENEPAPCIDVTGIGRDRQLTSQDLAWLLQFGGLNPDDTLEEAIRKEGELPPIDHATRRLEITEQPPGATPPDPNAETGGN